MKKSWVQTWSDTETCTKPGEYAWIVGVTPDRYRSVSHFTAGPIVSHVTRAELRTALGGCDLVRVLDWLARVDGALSRVVGTM